MQLIFEKSSPGRRGVRVAGNDVGVSAELDAKLMRSEPAGLPELSEQDVMRHFTDLSRKNFGVDTGFYPLGSCTMKYNPKVNERVASLPGFTELHPLLPQLSTGEDRVQGALAVLHNMDLLLRDICGMAAFTLQPLAGSHGELTGVVLMAAYHRDKGNDKNRILIPDSAHGTNPASAAIAGYEVQTVPSNQDGVMDIDALKDALDEKVAGVMLTCPNTLGLFNPHIKEICDLVHEVDGLMYYDGANLNAVIGRCRPGDIGFDICHLNLHKTFSTPHGGGGPGSGPVGVCERLVKYLPISIVRQTDDGHYYLDYETNEQTSIGYIAPFYGNFGIVLRAYTYLKMLGRDGLSRISEHAVLNANYIRRKLEPYYEVPYPQLCKHEVVLSAKRQAEYGVRAVDIAKALLDRGFHAPTVYFPLIVEEAMMIEPTETESKETLDTFIAAMIEIAQLVETNPEAFAAMPTTTPVTRLDETQAARKPDVALLP
jgi:glycine dehydrogenase subunit 2